jgi:hypothetical protein
VEAPDGHRRPQQRLVDHQPARPDDGELAGQQRPQRRGREAWWSAAGEPQVEQFFGWHAGTVAVVSS